ncbi:hypothetical protein CVIRNUC_005093 [Coccomyxa viridis]|uniref:Uncharacterized protein n=1 Tax=Coccomyxa viridis TaxID=1274662 RepID=A0AAV1I611_9CHLO|nr:hypothetical protein CVIRNUC_005093 [Coccomyxa viridis]
MASIPVNCSAQQPCLTPLGAVSRRQHSSSRAVCSSSGAQSQRLLSGTPLQGVGRIYAATSRRQQKLVTRMGLFGLGIPEVAVIAGVAVLIFGPSKLPELGRELGKSVKSFQTAAKEFESELKNSADDAADEGKKIADDVKSKVDDTLK